MKTVNLNAKKNTDDSAIIIINNITTSKFSIVYTDSCEVTIQKGNDCLFFPQGSFLFVERGIKFSFKMKKQSSLIKPYRAIRLEKEELIMLKNVFKSTNYYNLNRDKMKRGTEDKIICVNGFKEYAKTFEQIESVTDNSLKVLTLAYIISQMGIAEKITHSLIVSAAVTFTDKVQNIIEKDISRKWRLNMIADIFNISEISVRKRLESEGTSFNNLLINIRMNKALQLLLDNDLQIHQISKMLGILSPSYFIKNFKNHFGVTPKQFVIYFRC